ncbi:MAG: ribulose-phosphate 3-epimerase [Anaerolineae bacterium]|nr:ribulose-phosphate 3-epimerase [Anaerolineae bacterium]
MLKCAASLWSADLANLAEDIRRVEPHTDRFHIDVADGQYVNLLLFFPDLVRAMRPYTRLPFEVHLITRDPLRWVDPFVQAGADSLIFYHDAADDPVAVIRAIRSTGRKVGISLRVEDPVDILDPYWEALDVVTILGTHMGVKGVSMDVGTPDKIRQARAIITQRGVHTEIEADGGIRRETVPLLYAAGADVIVPGSLLFNEGPENLHKLLASL